MSFSLVKELLTNWPNVESAVNNDDTIKYQSQTLLCCDSQLNSRWEAQMPQNKNNNQNASSCHVEMSSYAEELFSLCLGNCVKRVKLVLVA